MSMLLAKLSLRAAVIAVLLSRVLEPENCLIRRCIELRFKQLSTCLVAYAFVLCDWCRLVQARTSKSIVAWIGPSAVWGSSGLSNEPCRVTVVVVWIHHCLIASTTLLSLTSLPSNPFPTGQLPILQSCQLPIYRIVYRYPWC
jgi:hypothetical protein